MKNLLAITILLAALNCSSQKGKTFPLMVGSTLENKGTSLPIKNGKQTIVAVAFNKGAEDELKKWLNPLYNTFMVKASGPKTIDVSAVYDVNFVFVPVINGLKKVAEDFKKGTDKAFWPHIMDTEKTDMKDVELILDIKDRKIPYIFVLDKNGVVLDVQTGNYSEDKIDAMEEAME
ncbi:hypothetical protein [Sediminibacterium sp.]|uniref:hypothetical protein n=1 Tax=Sediminibacterium sp. TaxID=1917865 RepID=UPI0027249C36|nr:hypothetical protein [Sediminibacterium sp.]MDO9000514.1 hypothetical protein [Bacteroidota bacterium]MDP3146918.1 hypothetical protein [Bacteroidota bacterium]MDP3567544.1 hypothetical protein [Sediminibacterium sp.]